MEITWDEPKRIETLTNRGLDFASLKLAFFASAVVIASHEGRWKAIALHEGIPTTVIFKPLGTEAISVISMRRASRQERKVL